MLKYESIQELVSAAENGGMKISELVLQDQAESMETEPEELYKTMQNSFEVMKKAVETGQKSDQRSMSGLTGGETLVTVGQAYLSDGDPVRVVSGEG